MSASTPLALKVLAAIGGTTLLYTAYRILSFLRPWILPPRPLTRYRAPAGECRWAVVTGASGGIGLGIAQELALRGFSVALVGRSRERLERAARLVAAEGAAEGVETKVVVLDAVTATPASIRRAVEAELAGLPISVLVNNVGGSPLAGARAVEFPRLEEHTAEEIDATLDFNVRFASHLTALLLPRLLSTATAGSGATPSTSRGGKRGDRALILNLLSGSRMGVPGLAMYSAAKAALGALSYALSRECRAADRPVDVLCVIPGEVRSQTNLWALGAGTPGSRAFATALLSRCVNAVEGGLLDFWPFLGAAVQEAMGGWLPERVLVRELVRVLDGKRAAYRQAK